ncbi:MAG TPA: cyclic nucleotide-binding domain-containing protein [Terriglobales bacterium]|nr:cyclic nucleotide-binding domain-containing protein [Terriglobales bacterium]
MVEEFPNKLPPGLWSALEGIRSMRTYAKGKLLFRWGQPARGVYLIEKGEVDLLLPTSAGSERFFEKAGPGVMLGLSEAMSGDTSKLTARAADRTQVAFVGREALLDFLRRHQAFCMQIVRLLSEDLHLLYHKYRCQSGAANRPRRTKPSDAASANGPSV